MSSFRQIHSKIWKDDWFLDLEPVDKLFFIYLFSNESATMIGLYELPIRVMSFESGLTAPEIRDTFQVFANAQKAYYENGVVFIPTMRKYHSSNSPKVLTRIQKDVDNVRDGTLKRFCCKLYGIDMISNDTDTLSIPPYIYTSTSSSTVSSSLKGGLGENGRYDGHAENTNSQELNDTIKDICTVVQGGDPLAPSDKILRMAHKIIDMGAADKILGFIPWWKENGQYNGQPSFTSFNNQFQNYLDGVERNQGNGKEKLTPLQKIVRDLEAKQ